MLERKSWKWEVGSGQERHRKIEDEVGSLTCLVNLPIQTETSTILLRPSHPAWDPDEDLIPLEYLPQAPLT